MNKTLSRKTKTQLIEIILRKDDVEVEHQNEIKRLNNVIKDLEGNVVAARDAASKFRDNYEEMKALQEKSSKTAEEAINLANVRLDDSISKDKEVKDCRFRNSLLSDRLTSMSQRNKIIGGIAIAEAIAIILLLL